MEEKIDISFEKIHLHVTGSVSSSLVPYWVNWSRRIYPDLQISVSVTKSAKKFVSVEALNQITEGRAWEDDWNSESYPQDIHNGLIGYTDIISIFPASINTVMQISSGLANSPMQLALQITDLPVVIAKSFPSENKIIKKNIDYLLSARKNFTLSKELPAYSISKKSWSSQTGFYYPYVLEESNKILEKIKTGKISE